MKRRRFLKIAGAGMALSPGLEQLLVAANDAAAGDGVWNNSASIDIRSLFESNNEQALALTEAVFRKCILDKIMPPTPPLENRWIVPGGPYGSGTRCSWSIC